MSYEYFSIRLRAMRTQFVAESLLDDVMEGKDPLFIANELEGSIFSNEINAIRSREGEISIDILIDAIEAGRVRIMKRLFEMIRPIEPDLAEMLFARTELLQIKAGLRIIKAGSRGVSSAEEGFINFRGQRGWIGGLKTDKTPERFIDTLKNTHHPLAKPLLSGLEKKEAAEIERSLETCFFDKFLSELPGLSKEALLYFCDQNDFVNLQLAATLRFSGASKEAVEDFYIPGPGSLTKKMFTACATATEEEFVKLVYKCLAIRLTKETVKKPARIGVAARSHFLFLYKKKVATQPFSVLEFFLFIEEFYAMTVNLSLALGYARVAAPGEEARAYFISGRMAS